jgi:hypothetical protein
MRWTFVVGLGVGAGLAGVAQPAHAQAAAAQAKPPAMVHDKAGRDNCLMCHGGTMEGMKAVPANHKGRANETCLLCHAKDSPMQTATPAAISHDVAGREQCLMCHGGAMEGIKAAPASHKGWDVKNCTLCHATAAK